MGININLKAKVQNLTVTDVFNLMAIYKETIANSPKSKEVWTYKGYKFTITDEVSETGITYIITEIDAD